MAKVAVVNVVSAILIIVPAALAAVGWVVFTGGFGASNTNAGLPSSNPSALEMHLQAPFYFSAIAAPVLLILMIVEGVIILFLRGKWYIHMFMIIAILLITIPLIAFNGYMMQALALVYTGAASLPFQVSLTSDPNNAMFAGLLLETFFLSISLAIIVVVLIIPANTLLNAQNLPKRMKEPFLAK